MAASTPDTIRAAEAPAPDVGRAHPELHPNRLLAIAMLQGLAPVARGTASVLELGCGDGADLLPIAAAYPQGRFAGVDPSSSAIASARRTTEGAGLRNVRLVEADVRTLPQDLGHFDVVIARDLYSRVQPEARDALMHAVARHLAPGGVACVGFDALPGGWLRRIGWDAMQFHARGATDPAERAARAREFIALLVDTWKEQPGTGAALAELFGEEAARDDAAILRDDLGPQNEPTYVSTVANHARRHGLALIGDTDPSVRSPGAAGAALRERLESRPPLAVEQMLDFVHLRSTRQALLVHASERLVAAPGLGGLHFAATPAHAHARAIGAARADPVGDLLVPAFPGSLPAEALIDGLRARGVADAAARVRAAWVQREVDPFVDALAIAAKPAERPRASALARWQATREPLVVNLRHESVRLADHCARQVLAHCDGTRTASGLALALRGAIPPAEAGEPQSAIERRLAQLASAALLEA